MRKLTKIPDDVSVYLRYLHQDLAIKGQALLSRFPEYSKANIYRHANKPIGSPVIDKRHNNPGRPPTLSACDKRAILQQVEVLRDTVGHFASKRVRMSAGIGSCVSDECVCHIMHRAGLRYRHSRRKGLLTRKDLKIRLAFARKVKGILNPEFWKNGISFYLDGVSFTHNLNPSDQARAPRTMAWRRPGEGLMFKSTAKGNHEGTGAKVAAIAYGKGVVLCEQFRGKLNGQTLSDFIHEQFPKAFANSANPRGKLLLQVGDPSQNSKKTRDAMDCVGAKKFSIPPRSTDLNSIENIFHQVNCKLGDDALERNIVKENFDQISKRVKETIESLPKEVIDRTIASMDKRIQQIIKSKGQRTKY